MLQVLYCAWSDTWLTVTAWLTSQDLSQTRPVTGEDVLCAWVEEDSACTFQADLCYCLANSEVYLRLHMTNLSVTLQESTM